jgi:GxxExxY protein
MENDEHRYEHDELTERVIGCAFVVANSLGHGFLEKVYENALAFELRKSGLSCVQQHPIPVRYDGNLVGEYFADLVVNDQLIVELKAVKALDDSHWSQCLNYLKGSGLRKCLLLNFGRPRIELRRISR